MNRTHGRIAGLCLLAILALIALGILALGLGSTWISPSRIL